MDDSVISNKEQIETPNISSLELILNILSQELHQNTLDINNALIRIDAIVNILIEKEILTQAQWTERLSADVSRFLDIKKQMQEKLQLKMKEEYLKDLMTNSANFGNA